MQLTWDDGCFVCGRDNPAGLRLPFTFDAEERSIHTVWTPAPEHIGYDGIVHGGLVATLLDEAVGKLSVCLETPGVTVEITVRYKLPVPVARPLTVVGKMVGGRGRLMIAKATAHLEDGRLAAEAEAKLLKGAPQ